MADQTNKFPGGVRIFPRLEKQPDFVKGTITISLNEFIDFCKANPDLLTDYNGVKQLKMQILVSKESKLYLSVDSFKAAEAQPQTSQAEDWSKPAQQNAASATTGTAATGVSANDLPF